MPNVEAASGRVDGEHQCIHRPRSSSLAHGPDNRRDREESPRQREADDTRRRSSRADP